MIGLKHLKTILIRIDLLRIDYELELSSIPINLIDIVTLRLINRICCSELTRLILNRPISLIRVGEIGSMNIGLKS